MKLRKPGVKRRFAAAFLICLFCFTNIKTASAAAPDTLRVGLSTLRSSDGIKLTGGSIAVGLSQGGYFSSAADISGDFTVSSAQAYYVIINDSIADYYQARSLADSYIYSGYKASVAFRDPGRFAVYLGGYTSEAEAMPAAASVSGQAQAALPTSIAILNGGEPFIVFDSSSYAGRAAPSASGYIGVGGRDYRGAVEFVRNSSAITPVNVLTMDDYLLSIVAYEMSAGFHIDALKAQTVACRSYAAYRINAHTDLGYNICDTSHCHTYKGAEGNSAAISRAVTETSGIMAYYNGSVIDAVYFSSSGGMTANSEDVWSAAIPYQRSVTDTYETTGKVWERAFTSNEITSLLGKNGANIGTVTGVAIGGVNASGRVSSLVITGTAGTKTLEKEEIRTFFSGSTGGMLESRYFALGTPNGGTAIASPYPTPNTAAASYATDISVIGAAVSGIYPIDGMFVLSQNGTSSRISGDISAAGAAGTNVITARQAYQPEATQPQSGLPAAGGLTFAQTGTIVFYGRGWGHGVGLSQHGANCMAGKGYSFYDILKFYYTGIEVR